MSGVAQPVLAEGVGALPPQSRTTTLADEPIAALLQLRAIVGADLDQTVVLQFLEPDLLVEPEDPALPLQPIELVVK